MWRRWVSFILRRSLLLRRLLAFLVDIVLWLLVCAVALLWDLESNWLYGYDGSAIGMVLLVAYFVLSELLLGSTVGKWLFRLRIVCWGGINLRVPQLVFRSMLFWVFVLSPGAIIPYSGLFTFLGDRLAIIASLATGLSLVWILPFSVGMGKGRTGIHDLMTLTRVEANYGSLIFEGGDRSHPYGWSRFSLLRLAKAYVGIWCSLVLFTTMVEWEGDLGRRVKAFIGVHRYYLDPRLPSSPEVSGTLSPRVVFQSRNGYYVSRDISLKGDLINFKIPVSVAVVQDDTRRMQFAGEIAIHLDDMVPSVTQWIGIDLYAMREFGVLALVYESRFLVNVAERTMDYAPALTKYEEKGSEVLLKGERDTVLVAGEDSVAGRRIEIKIESLPSMEVFPVMGWGFGLWKLRNLDFRIPKPEIPSARLIDLRRHLQSEMVKRLEQGRVLEALHLSGWLLDIWPYNPNTPAILGNIFASLGDHEESEKAFDVALQLREDYPPFWAGRAHAHLMIGDLEHALSDYLKAAELSPFGIRYWREAVLIAHQLGRKDVVLRGLTQLYMVNPLLITKDQELKQIWESVIPR